MSKSGMAALLAGLLLWAMVANAAVLKKTMRITVLDSATRAATDDSNGVPNNCEQLTFDAYCRSSTNVPLVSTLLVQEGDEPPFWITCKIDSRYSRCTPLPKGAAFDARREKRGITVYFVDDNGKPRKQLYALVAATGNASPPAAAAVATQPVPAAAAPPRSSPSPGSAPQSAVAPQNSSAPPAAVAAAQATVKCSFDSTPSGAEITLDGQYVGSTPSVLSLSLGAHAVEVSMPGFAAWKRNLTVAAGSELTVNAVLEKVQ